jgi:CRP-like cAMP-binding protein/CheY-like chemotaxis protein
MIWISMTSLANCNLRGILGCSCFLFISRLPKRLTLEWNDSMSERSRILLVEDDAFISLDVSEVLKEFGYEVVGAVPSGQEAVETARKEKPDLILMDINLQGPMDGITAAEVIHKDRPIPVVFLSALSDESTLQRARLVGPFGYLIKPFEPAELHSTIQVALDRAASQKPAEEVSGDDSFLADAALHAELGDVGEREAILSKIHLLADLPKEKLSLLAACCSITTVDAGEFIHIEESKAEKAFIVLTGRVSITKTSDAGKELILALLGPGDSFGLLYMLPSFGQVASAKAQLDSKLLAFSQAHFSKLLKEFPGINNLLLTEMTARLSASYSLAMSLAHSRVESRIVATLNSLVSTIAKSSSKSQNEVRIFITRKELADLTGTTPETAIRVTKQLERDGMLDLSRPGIIKIPDTTKLKEL